MANDLPALSVTSGEDTDVELAAADGVPVVGPLGAGSAAEGASSGAAMCGDDAVACGEIALSAAEGVGIDFV